MDYFALFSLPVSLLVDKSKVLSAYYRLCQQHHPDRADENDVDEAMRMTADINRAKTVLEDPMLRLEYLLQQNGYMPADEKFNLPPAFLADMMDLNEALMDARFEEDAEAIQTVQQQITERAEALKWPVAEYFAQAEFMANAEAWEQLKLYYYQHKYLLRLARPNQEM
jgi:molecular chaperone HscB